MASTYDVVEIKKGGVSVTNILQFFAEKCSAVNSEIEK